MLEPNTTEQVGEMVCDDGDGGVMFFFCVGTIDFLNINLVFFCKLAMKRDARMARGYIADGFIQKRIFIQRARGRSKKGNQKHGQ